MSNSSSNAGGAISPIPKGGLGLFSKDTTAEFSIPAPFTNKICLIEDTHIAGTTHVEGIDGIVEQVTKGQDLRFERDKGNLHDYWAIKVFAGNDRVGFVPCDINEILARMMDGGKRVFGAFAYGEKLGRWNKLHMEVYLDD